MENPDPHRKTRIYIFTTIGLVVLALVVYFVFFNTAVITLEVSPKDAVVTANNAPQTVNNSGVAKFSLRAGSYTLSVEANKFVPYQQKLSLKGGSRISQTIALHAIPDLTLLDASVALAQKYGDNLVSYLGDDKKTLYSISAVLDSSGKTALGPKNALTPPVFANVDKVIFSTDKALAIIKVGTDAYLYDFNRYDILHQDMKKISSDVGDVTWAPDRSRIAYYYAPPSGERSLIFADPLNQNPERVLTLTGIDNPSLAWSADGNQILVVPHGQKSADNKVYIFDVYLKQLKSLTDFGGVLGAQFSGDGSHIIYFVSTNDPKSTIKSAVSVMDRSGDNKRSLNINATPDQGFVQDKGSIIFITSIDDQPRVMLYNLNDASIKELFFNLPAKSIISGVFLSLDHKIVYVSTATGLFSARYADNQY